MDKKNTLQIKLHEFEEIFKNLKQELKEIKKTKAKQNMQIETINNDIKTLKNMRDNVIKSMRESVKNFCNVYIYSYLFLVRFSLLFLKFTKILAFSLLFIILSLIFLRVSYVILI